MTSREKNLFTYRTLAILFIASGYGWAGGHFIPIDAPLLAYAFQGILILILFFFSLGFFSQQYGKEDKSIHGRWPIIGLTIFALLSLFINIGNIVRGVSNTNPNGFGSHNHFPDLVPIGILIAGDLVWLLSILIDKGALKKSKS
jgi:hypothetical protein